ncbi:SOS response-associated peptidase [Saxibacter everestensis]|uniref:Abasic site processing protein n=1 Tax=Saxibacter everestensis TaxID=2909229 RepID=A0ABY8QPB2_9MICO|nr:SOS response-associated peptidase [Brevibacteriaceae bacterium ZFBP1038]
MDPEDLANELECVLRPDRELPPSWNKPPTSDLYIVADRPDKQTGDVRRRLEIARWGLVPSWAKDVSSGSRLFNARLESVAEKPAYRKAAHSRRCLVPATGYYEWRAGSDGKQPFFIHAAADEWLCFAGLFEFWRDRSKPDDDPSRWLVSTTIITAAAKGDLADIHDRMPVVLDRRDYDRWLDPSSGADEALGLLSDTAGLQPGHAVELAWHRVGREVGSVAVDRPELAEEIRS